MCSLFTTMMMNPCQCKYFSKWNPLDPLSIKSVGSLTSDLTRLASCGVNGKDEYDSHNLPYTDLLHLDSLDVNAVSLFFLHLIWNFVHVRAYIYHSFFFNQFTGKITRTCQWRETFIPRWPRWTERKQRQVNCYF